MNVWDFGPLGTAITRLQRGRFLTFATTLNSFIDIINQQKIKFELLLVFSVTPSKIDDKIKIKTIRQIKSRIWEMKGRKYTKTLAKIWVKGITRLGDIRGNVLPKFIELCMETPC